MLSARLLSAWGCLPAIFLRLANRTESGGGRGLGIGAKPCQTPLRLRASGFVAARDDDGDDESDYGAAHMDGEQKGVHGSILRCIVIPHATQKEVLPVTAGGHRGC